MEETLQIYQRLIITDFLYARKDDMSSVSSSSRLKDNLLKFFDTNTTLYISTDEPNKAFFNDVLQEYQDVYFFHDFEEYSHLSKLEIAFEIDSRPSSLSRMDFVEKLV